MIDSNQNLEILPTDGKALGISIVTYWASEASPTLGCSIEISRDICIYVYMCVCRGPKSVGGITWAKRAHAQSQYWAVKSDQ